MKKEACLVLTMIIMLLAGERTALATSGGLSLPDRQIVVSAIASKEALYGPLTLIEGEVVSVDRDSLQLLSDLGVMESYHIPTSCKVFINGRPGFLPALRPVASGSFFAARIYLDREQIPRLVDGWYVGGLATIIAVDARRHTLCVQAVESDQVYCLGLSPALRPEVTRLTQGNICFLLLGWEAEVRKIYLDQ